VRRLEQVALSHHTENTRNILMQIIALDQEVLEHKGHGASDAVLHQIQERWAEVSDSSDPDGTPARTLKRMLLVDDEPFMRNTLGSALSRLGYRVDFAETKCDALARLAAGGSRYDVVLCDLYLPDGTGMEILSEHRKRESNTPFILMTAYDSPRLDDILGCGNEPPLLFKPFRMQDLMTIIRSEVNPEADLIRSTSPDRAPPSVLSAGRRTRVLIVDDSVVIREHVVSQLNELSDIEIVGQAGTVEQATSALRQFKPDVMTLDLRLPDGNGLNILRLIQREGLSTAVIVLTSFPYPQYEMRARAAGAYAFLNKARDFDKLAEQMQALIKRRTVAG
jgi:DNA-binding NarL/FixJ family response regulator